MANASLDSYRKKRDFGKTGEPRGRKGKGKNAGLDYLIQKHAASRLHYDFRLELDGVLKSWAVTKGPSLDPETRRLAVHVEDHPLEYGTFEGTIPKGQYGGGTVMLWDRGTWEPIGDPHKTYAKGRLDFVLHGERLKGRWHLVRMHGRDSGKKENWLLIKGGDEEANRKTDVTEKYQTSVATRRGMDQIAAGNKEWRSNRAQEKKPETKTEAPKTKAAPRAQKKRSGKGKKLPPPPDFVSPQLATLVSAPPDAKGWVHEIKFDGYRALARVDGDDIALLTRAGNDWTQKFRSIPEELRALDIGNALIDGEITALNGDGGMSFHALQQALSENRQDKLHYYAFDLLFLDGEDMQKKPLLERKEALRKIIPSSHPRLHFSEHFSDPGSAVLEHACHIALEGIVSKRADAGYSSGRGDGWLKSKCINEQEMVIGGFTYQPKHPQRLAALLLGTFEKGELVYSGKVGTGFSHDEAIQLVKKFKPYTRKTPPFASVPTAERRNVAWLEPKLVAQIAFTEWTEGGALRHPSWQGLREDKPAAQVTRERKARPSVAKSSARPSTKPKSTGKPDSFAGVTLTHPDKVLYPESHLTKRDLAEYYIAVADHMLPHVIGRPISLVRCPEGEGKPCFFQRHSGEGLSPHIDKIDVNVKGDKRPYISLHDAAGLIALAQMGVLEIHIWGARAGNIEHPDRIVFDFDPAEDVPWNKVKDAALEVKKRLAALKLKSFLKTTGGKGLHVVVPIAPKNGWDIVKTFARVMAEQMAKENPRLYTTNMRKSERKGRIFIDYLRNDKTASAIAPYSTRAKPGAPVALPIEWRELPKLKSAHEFSMRDAIARIKKTDPWKEILKLRQKLPL